MLKNDIVPDRIFTISNVLSPEECAEYITLTENIGYTPAGLTVGQDLYEMNPEVRNNDRVILDDEERAEELWGRVADCIPAAIDNRWTVIGLNERLRFYRYDPGQRFAPHGDGPHFRSNGECSQLTFMIYLNDGFEGGETHFYLHHNYLELFEPSVIPSLSVVPKMGMALCFIHELRHEGSRVISGRKYVLRSDVMYSLRRHSYILPC
ncbi:MAG: 2OG-Fe(II) oxygenase [Oscillatoriales cyanobacterium RU_3_3]|nr:2OG-Fe(II) oxygenase [Microcoleus sp. SU_5_6]NJL67102.1 2OG-Fe(II) oxygenase [Microcoleus sp. SM1_3_4]NJM63185.1 2OG-Fe(II) oxygenase [Oscillatoriales cyanobacterium RU_3_3]NJR25149.1 2OG-Fe(II) oxygenase [Richelia sp. CSU_2_1]